MAKGLGQAWIGGCLFCNRGAKAVKNDLYHIVVS